MDTEIIPIIIAIIAALAAYFKWFTENPEDFKPKQQ
jgi:hypothetical protein